MPGSAAIRRLHEVEHYQPADGSHIRLCWAQYPILLLPSLLLRDCHTWEVSQQPCPALRSLQHLCCVGGRHCCKGCRSNYLLLRRSDVLGPMHYASQIVVDTESVFIAHTLSDLTSSTSQVTCTPEPLLLPYCL